MFRFQIRTIYLWTGIVKQNNCFTMKRLQKKLLKTNHFTIKAQQRNNKVSVSRNVWSYTQRKSSWERTMHGMSTSTFFYKLFLPKMFKHRKHAVNSNQNIVLLIGIVQVVRNHNKLQRNSIFGHFQAFSL